MTTHLAPGPSGLPLVGSGLHLRRDLLGTLERGRREYGDIVLFRVGPERVNPPFVALFHPDGVRHALATEADHYRKDTAFYEEVRWSLGEGLLNAQDETWLRQRRFVQPLFTRKRIDTYAEAMTDESEQLVARWRPLGEVDLAAEMSRFTLRVVGRILFGADVERALPAVATGFPIIGRFMVTRGTSPVKLPRHWPTPGNRRVGRARAALYAACDELIAERRAAEPGGQDLLSLLIDAREAGEGLDDREIRDQILIFLLAGHDTTAVALTFALHLLGHHPETQRRVREEVDATDDVSQLPYTTMVLKESMRLYPPAWGFGRRAQRDDVFGGYDIPAGWDVVTSPWVTHRHPDFWPDPLRFDPERFTPEAEAERHRHAWFPFGAGPRACIGQYFSMLEATIALATLARHFEFASLADQIPLVPGITLHPAAPVPARVGSLRAVGV